MRHWEDDLLDSRLEHLQPYKLERRRPAWQRWARLVLMLAVLLLCSWAIGRLIEHGGLWLAEKPADISAADLERVGLRPTRR